MIISKNWLNEWVDLSGVSTDTIVKTLNSIGFEVDGYKEIKIPDNIVVGYVSSKQKHPDADKLSVCQVDIGTESLQIVCGAKNVESGQFVAVALVGAVMPNGLEIKRAKLRGVESCGMICSSTELGLAKTNDGIMVLDESIGKLELGKSVSEFAVFNDAYIEIDITANRGDCQSINGIAREIAVALDLNLKENMPYEDIENLPGIGRIVTLHADESVKSSVVYRAFNIHESISESLLTKLRLGIIECDKTCHIERILEYATYSTGVLLRAYDYDKLKDNEKAIFNIKNGENQECIIQSNDKILGVAGVYQDKSLKADSNSSIVIVEASYSNPEIITEFVGKNKNIQKDPELYRSSRGSEPNLNYGIEYLFKKLLNLKQVTLYAGSQQHIARQDIKMLSVSLSDINKMIGQDIQRSEIIRILKKLGFDVVFNQELESFNIKVPFFRHDIANSHDICEEIVRIVGIDNIASKPLNFSESNRLNDTYKRYKFALNLRHRSASVGFFESIHYVFDNAGELSKLGFKPCKVSIVNPINNELNELRPTLVNHLLNSCEKNIKNSKRSVKLFECGSVFDEQGTQSERFGFIACGLSKELSIINGAKVAEIDFLTFANLIQSIIGKFELKTSDDICYLSPYEQAKIYKDNTLVGYIGRIHIDISDARDLPKTYVSEIYFDKLVCQSVKAVAYSKFPSVSRDLSLVVPDSIKFEKIKECINSLNLKNLKEFLPIDIYRSPELGNNASVSIKFTFQDMQSSLTDDEVSTLMDMIVSSLKDRLGIDIR